MQAVHLDGQDGLVFGRVYDAGVETDRQRMPDLILRAALEGGRLRCARYDGGGHWHVFDDREMQDYERQRTAPDAAPKLVEETTGLVKLDFGCGIRPREGYEGVDLYGDKVTHRVNLFKFPYPFADESVDDIHSSHFIEHIPNREIEERDLAVDSPEVCERFLGQDMLLAFFDECYRILKPFANCTLVYPNARSDGAFQDPTHRRYLNQNTMFYLSKKDRIELGLEHYKVRCDFEYRFLPVGPVEEGARHPEVQFQRFNHYWNTILEWHVTLKKRG